MSEPSPPATTTALPVLNGSPYVAYSYAYPHKTAYRRLDPALALREVWRPERRDQLFLYAHIPFCRMRCGFCNLFTMTHPDPALPDRFLDAMAREMDAVLHALESWRFVRLAIGGGTPTFLDAAQLDRLGAMLESMAQLRIADLPASIESSPETLDAERLAVIESYGYSRISMGVQTFDEAEARRLGRPQSRATLERALALLDATSIPTVNLDLIYGGEGQSPAAWRDTVREAIQIAPEELYLYPLYVRPLTGLDRHAVAEGDDERLAAYRIARDELCAAGYEQLSMRLFRRAGAPDDADAPVYCCQADGMVGLGAGARSYTTSLHYSSEYAVRRASVRDIVEAYAATSSADFSVARHGIRLDADEQRRRDLILSLLQRDGLDRAAYAARFSRDPLDDFPALRALAEAELITIDPRTVRLTPAGLERSDAIGPQFYSDAVLARSAAYAWS